MPTLQHVRELSLLGPGGLVVAADSVFLGIPFREVSRSLVTGEDEARLLEAWSSRRDDGEVRLVAQAVQRVQQLVPAGRLVTTCRSRRAQAFLFESAMGFTRRRTLLNRA
ncbi:MAG TPA: hypothetical protein VEO54_02060 [Thermoanaerobaculia bacterium]|nr:hypothetical protein [Thermoanaerobaculia bacterium]